jgi:DNA-binding phage protein
MTSSGLSIEGPLAGNRVSEMGEKLTTYDPAEDLVTDEAMAVFVEEAFKTEDAGYIAHALGIVARAKEMTEKSRPL